MNAATDAVADAVVHGDAGRRALTGAAGGLGGTVVLSGLRTLWTKAGLVSETAPMQVVSRVEELGLIGEPSPAARRLLTLVAHLSYGVGTGTAFGLLRRERGDPAQEAAVGSALGILAWGMGWSSWLPLAGVHRAPWTQRTPKVLLPIVDHAVYGVVWGLVNLALNRRYG